MRPFPKTPQQLVPPYKFGNSSFAIDRFPFPFKTPLDSQQPFKYSANIEPHEPGKTDSATEFYLDIDEHYLTEMLEKKRVLNQRKNHCLVLDHMKHAEWEWFEHVTRKLAQDYPHCFELEMAGDCGCWKNHLLDIEQEFTLGKNSLPSRPLAFLGGQVQGDFALLDQREHQLYLDAGIITGPSDWSLAFDIGMDFTEWHKPVPDAEPVFERALNYLLGLQAGSPVRRLNWILCVYPRLDRSLESYPDWALDKQNLTPDRIGDDLFLRVELQVLDRLPKTRAIMFSIRTYFLSMNDLLLNPHRALAFYQTIKTLPKSICDYKGISPLQSMLVAWLEQKLEKRLEG